MSQAPENTGDSPPDVRDIMATIRQNVERKKREGIYREEDWSDVKFFGKGRFPGRNGDDLTLLSSTATIDLDGEPITSHRPVAGYFIKSIKKFTRYWVRKYTDALFLQQSQFNTQTAKMIADLKKEVEELRDNKLFPDKKADSKDKPL